MVKRTGENDAPAIVDRGQLLRPRLCARYLTRETFYVREGSRLWLCLRRRPLYRIARTVKRAFAASSHPGRDFD